MSSLQRPISFEYQPAAFQASRRRGWSLPLRNLETFVIFQFICQLALLIPGIGAIRLGLRVAAFGASLLLLLMASRRVRRHPASWAGLCVIGILALSLFHPWGNSMIAAVAQVGMYSAILAPLFWVPKFNVTAATFRRVAMIFWGFHTLSAGVGVLQVYFPGRFQPPVSQVVQAKGDDYVDSLKISLSNGVEVFRPMGLTDQPGGAATAGLYAVLFGLGLLLTERQWGLRIACAIGIALGLFCLYLAQVRSVFIMTGICVVAFCALLVVRGEIDRFVKTLAMLSLLVLVSFAWAVSMGGKAVTGRLSSLVAERADEVYANNRGYFLQDTILNLLPQYPFGAGLGRWGMMNQYFGDNSNPQTTSIWVEIQWTGWLLDGGVPLILAYVAALWIAFVIAWKIALNQKSGNLGLWSSLLFAYNLAAIAVTFNYPLFIGQGGLEFWLLNAALFGAYQASRQDEVVA